MSSRASTDSRHKKILRTRVKVWGRFLLPQEEVFNIDKAEQLIHRALDGKTSVQTVIKMYGDGMRIGDKGVLAALHAEFLPYPSIVAFISLREMSTMLALSNKAGTSCCVTIIQFKDVEALEVVCDLIDRQRGITTKGVGSLARSDTGPKPAAAVTAPAAKPPAQAPVTVAVTSKDVIVEQPKPKPPTPTTAAEDFTVVVTASSSNGNGGLLETRPYVGEITQPPVTTKVAAVVHASTPYPSAAAPVEDDDENHFRTSIVFGEEETMMRQRRMESVLQLRASTVSSGNGHAKSKDCIDTVILNYDEIDTEGTHAVFDTPEGPPIQLNESTENLRYRTSQLQVTANASPASGNRGSRLVVTSFSSGRSDSDGLSDSQVYLRAASAESEPSYRTSTIIYRDAPPPPESPTERPHVTYVTKQRSSTMGSAAAAQHSPQQSMQLVRLVPVSSARRRVVQQPAQLYTIQPVSARENGVH